MNAENQTLEQALAATLAGERSLPARFYTDPAILDREKHEIFFRTWQYACHTSQLSSPGDFVSISLFEQSIFLIHDDTHVVRAFFNVCPHRGHPLLSGEGKVHRLVCPYHAWTYDLQGRLKSARGAERSSLTSATGICLSPVRVERLLDFFFVNLDPHAAPLSEFANELESSLVEIAPDLSDYHLEPQLEYIGAPFECNWKVMMDNQLECYHCENAHPGFAKVMNLTHTSNVVGTNLVVQNIPTRPPTADSPFPYNRPSDVTEGNFWTLFPNTVLARAPGSPGLSISRIQPLSAARTTRVIQVLSHPDADTKGDEERTRWLRDGVIAEDRRLCEAVQNGMNQIGFTQGHYAIDNQRHHHCEEPVRFFHQRYLRALGETS